MARDVAGRPTRPDDLEHPRQGVARHCRVTRQEIKCRRFNHAAIATQRPSISQTRKARATGKTSRQSASRGRVVWSGASRSTRIKDRTERRKPSAWRSGNPKTSLSVNAVSIARSENFRCAPRRPDGDGVHASVASAESQSVMSPRWTSARSYSGQFPTRYFVLYLGCTLDFMPRSWSVGSHNGQAIDRCSAGV